MRFRFDMDNIQGGPKKWHSFLYALTSSNINRFSKLFHCRNQEKTCNNTVTKDPTTPQVCRYTTLWNVNVRKSTSIAIFKRSLNTVCSSRLCIQRVRDDFSFGLYKCTV